jgi:hypothetical protein
MTLRASLSPFTFDEKDCVIIAISDMLSGFRSLRHSEEDAVAMLDSLQRVLAEFPLWAIEEGCRAIHQGRAFVDGRKLDRRYPPHDPEIYGVIEGIVKPFREALHRARALLDAPIDAKRATLDKSN